MSVDLEDQLRQAFRERADATQFTLAPAGHLARPDLCRAPRRRRWVRPMLAAAAITAVASAIVFAPRFTGSSPSTAGVIGPVVINDPRALGLDVARDGGLAQPVTPRRPYLTVDADALPEGWTVDVVWQGALLDVSGGAAPAVDLYRVQATLTTQTGVAYGLSIERSATDPLPETAKGRDTLSDQGRLMFWRLEGGAIATLDTSDPDGFDDIQEVASQIPFKGTDTLAPLVALPGSDLPTPDDADFAGTISGTRWWATIGCCSLRAISVASELEGGSGAISNDRLSQPTDDPATETHYMITGVPTAGAVIAGYTVPAASTVVLLDRGRTVAVLPVVHARGAAFFAAPVPDGLHVDTLTIRADTTELERLAIPPIPSALVGSYSFG